MIEFRKMRSAIRPKGRPVIAKRGCLQRSESTAAGDWNKAAAALYVEFLPIRGPAGKCRSMERLPGSRSGVECYYWVR